MVSCQYLYDRGRWGSHRSPIGQKMHVRRVVAERIVVLVLVNIKTIRIFFYYESDRLAV